MEQPADSKFRMCYKAEEHLKHIVVGCTTLVLSEYAIRVCQWHHYYVEQTGYPDRTILANRSYIVLHDKIREDLPTDQYSHTR
jgi:hypothetical protein